MNVIIRGHFDSNTRPCLLLMVQPCGQTDAWLLALWIKPVFPGTKERALLPLYVQVVRGNSLLTNSGEGA